MGVQGLEQSVAVMRLGLKLALNPKRCSLHFQLNAANPEHADVAKKLVDMAQKVATAFSTAEHLSNSPGACTADCFAEAGLYPLNNAYRNRRI